MSIDNAVVKPSDKSVYKSIDKATLTSAFLDAFSKLAVKALVKLIPYIMYIVNTLIVLLRILGSSMACTAWSVPLFLF